MNIEDKFEEAKIGKEIWDRLKSKYGITESDVIVIISDDSSEFISKSIKYLREYTKKKNLERELILYCDASPLDDKYDEADNQRIYIKLQEKEIQSVLRLYRLVQFTKNIVVLSLSDPYAGAGIIGKVGITMDDYIKDAIYV